MSVLEFMELEYFPHVSTTLSVSTVDGYKKLFRAYGRYFEPATLDMRTGEAQAILRSIALINPQLNKTSLGHIKHFFGGVWTHAIRMDQCSNNPWRYVALPSAPEAGETHAYSPETIETIIEATPAPYDLIVLLAATTGLRKSEIRGLRWSDWGPETSTLTVNRAVWGAHTGSTKSRASKAPVPVVPALAARLTAALPKGPKCTGWMFPGATGRPLDLDNLTRRVIKPALAKNTWRGWHAFRRGLATYLHAQGVPDKDIQAILRHENVTLTQKCYVKTIPANVRAAMSTVKFGETR